MNGTCEYQKETYKKRPIKRATNLRVLLRKMTYENKASYDSTPPCANESCFATNVANNDGNVNSRDLVHTRRT